jgi:hypothetical protein
MAKKKVESNKQYSFDQALIESFVDTGDELVEIFNKEFESKDISSVCNLSPRLLYLLAFLVTKTKLSLFVSEKFPSYFESKNIEELNIVSKNLEDTFDKNLDEFCELVKRLRKARGA